MNQTNQPEQPEQPQMTQADLNFSNEVKRRELLEETERQTRSAERVLSRSKDEFLWSTTRCSKKKQKIYLDELEHNKNKYDEKEDNIFIEYFKEKIYNLHYLFELDMDAFYEEFKNGFLTLKTYRKNKRMFWCIHRIIIIQFILNSERMEECISFFRQHNYYGAIDKQILLNKYIQLFNFPNFLHSIVSTKILYIDTLWGLN